MAQIYKTAIQDAERFRLEKAIAERDDEIERLRVKYGGAVDRFCDENAKVNALEKREAALLAFVAADDAVALHNNQELIACSEFASGVAWHRELSQLENTKDEAREQLRRLIDDN